MKLIKAKRFPAGAINIPAGVPDLTIAKSRLFNWSAGEDGINFDLLSARFYALNRISYELNQREDSGRSTNFTKSPTFFFVI